MQCRFKYCNHKSKEIKDNEPYDKVGTCYYHADCNQTRIQMNNIATKFLECINDKVSIPELKKVISRLCFDEGYGSKYVEFALDYAILHPEFKLTYPAGLYRMCRSLDVVKAWDEKNNKEFVQSISKDTFVAEEKEVKELKKSQDKQSTGFSRILRRH